MKPASSALVFCSCVRLRARTCAFIRVFTGVCAFACAFAFVFTSRVSAQQGPDFNAALDIAGVSFTSTSWQTIGAAGSRDGVDAATSGDIVCVPFGPVFAGTNAFSARFGAPCFVTWWQRFAPPPGYSSEFSFSKGPLSGQATLVGQDGPWVGQRVEIGPAGSLYWTARLQGSAPGTFSNNAAVDQISVEPLPVVSVEEAMDSPGVWTLSAPGSWQGVQSALASSGGDYLWMPAGAPGAESWVERSFTGPARVSWKWMHDSTDANIRLLMDGVPFTVTYSASWTNAFADIDAGTHTLRWAATTPASGRIASVALDAVTTGPAVSIADMLGTPGRTWVRGGFSQPQANANFVSNYIYGHPTLVEFHPEPGQQSWLETTVTGPGGVQFWAAAPSGSGAGRVTLGSASWPIGSIGSGSYYYYRLSVPPGTHTLRISFSSYGLMDTASVWSQADTPSALLGQPEWPLLEWVGEPNTSRLGGLVQGQLSVNSSAAFSLAAPPLLEPALFSVDYTGPAGVMSGYAGGSGKSLTPGIVNNILTGPGAEQVSFSTTASASGCRIGNLTRSLIPRVPLNTALDTSIPLTASTSGQVLGLGGGVGWDGTDCVWLQGAAQGSAAGDPAWLEFSIGVSATVTMRYRGLGKVLRNGTLVGFSYQGFNEEWTQATWPVAGSATFRIQTDPTTGQGGLFIDSLTVTPAGPVSLDTALEYPGWTTSGANAWTGVYDPATAQDYAAPPALQPGGEAWIETSITGPFEFTWSAGPGDSLRFEIDGELRADTALPSSSPIRVQVPSNGTPRRCRWTAVRSATATGPSSAPPRLWSIDTSPNTPLAYIAQGAFALTEAVFWASNWTGGGSMSVLHRTPLIATTEPAYNSSSGTAGIYCSGTGTLKYNASVGVSVTGNPLHPGGSASLTFQGNSVANPDGENTHPVTTTGLTCLTWYGSITDMADTNAALSLGQVAVSNIRWLPGNTAWRTWTAARGLTGFAADTTADTDRDGLPAGLEYMLGSDPLAANAAPLTLIPAGGGAAGGFRLTVPKPPWPVTGSTLRLETSADLSAWTTAPPGALVEETAGTLTWEVPANGGGRAFARLAPVIAPD